MLRSLVSHRRTQDLGHGVGSSLNLMSQEEAWMKLGWALGKTEEGAAVLIGLSSLAPGEDEEMADLMEDLGVRSVSTSC